MRNPKHNDDGNGSIISETEIISIKNGCEDIMPKWEKTCPKCHRIQTYSNKYKLERAISDKSKCFNCCQDHRKIVKDSDVYIRNCPVCEKKISYRDKSIFYTAIRKNSKCPSCRHLGIRVSESTKQKLSELAKLREGHSHTKQHREKISGSGNPMYGVHRYDELNPFYGKRHDAESKRKMRIATCKRVLELQRSSNGRINNIGRKEDAYFVQMEAEHGWDGIYYGKSGRQFLVEDLGYFVDYYEPNLNIVVEYDEPRHYKWGNLKEQDIRRMEEIKSNLRCEFWRYDEYRKCLVRFH